MKPFKFSLEAVATTRRRLEQTALETYAQALLARQGALNQLEAIQHELKPHGCGCARRSNRVAQPRRPRGCGRKASFGGRTQVARRRAGASRTWRESELAANALSPATARSRGKFRGKQRLAYDRDVQRDTQKFLDELATQRATPAQSRALPRSARMKILQTHSSRPLSD